MTFVYFCNSLVVLYFYDGNQSVGINEGDEVLITIDGTRVLHLVGILQESVSKPYRCMIDCIKDTKIKCQAI